MRTDNDTWDITTSVGSTALFVAAARALEAQKPDPVAVDPFAEIFCRAVGGQWADLLDGAAPEHALKSEFGADFVNFQGVRTRYFDTYFSRAATAGVRQIVLLAAGLDSRAYRLDWPDKTVVFELDQPQVLDFKRAALAGVRPTAERRAVAVDLRDDWPRALLEHGFDPSSPTAWIAEGLLIYLPATAQVALFAGIDALSASGSHVAVEESVPMDPEEFTARQQEEERGDSSAHGGPFFQLVYNEQDEPAAQWFGVRGWRSEVTPLSDYLRALGRPVPSPKSDAGTMTSTISLVGAIKG
ncbi:class I SAM-dependent methyltransferase [Mycobacterium neglectum]|jgi:methyltransferase (TIGR00027 family)|uniref:class I SAM-dependent methyltransferase n=1 Tax=Mycobacterium neglectum TaxID=242737 RepID=UPI000BFEE1F0|nr:class I SAM-dependent methyltransferase [Mycobacterium neglectum]